MKSCKNDKVSTRILFISLFLEDALFTPLTRLLLGSRPSFLRNISMFLNRLLPPSYKLFQAFLAGRIVSSNIVVVYILKSGVVASYFTGYDL